MEGCIDEIWDQSVKIVPWMILFETSDCVNDLLLVGP